MLGAPGLRDSLANGAYMYISRLAVGAARWNSVVGWIDTPQHALWLSVSRALASHFSEVRLIDMTSLAMQKQ